MRMLAGAQDADQYADIAATFAPRLIAWQRQHGRRGLPWQHTHDPYRVWLSEVMLQQTQVSTVVAYYGRFLEQFPDVIALANASEDAVLAQWSGLGYYSRARNLHRCAQIVRDSYQGVFPSSKAALEQLPGIGASTAAAIVAFCFGERTSIFDANVQRVMARLLACAADLSRSASRRSLLERAEALLPAAKPAATRHDRMVAYTQGLMDLGATVCLPRQPACERCPVAELCQARAQGRPLAYPVKTGKLKRTAETWWLLALVYVPEEGDGSGSKLWLQKRPQPGIWGGLHCLPVLHSEAAWRQLVQQLNNAAVGVQSCTEHAPIKHVLTHKDLMLHPVVVRVADAAACTQTLASSLPGGWQAHWADVGLPAPVRKWLDAHLASFV